MNYWRQHAWRGFSAFVAILCIVAIGMMTFLLTRLPAVPATPQNAPGGLIEYKDLISIILTALSAMIALLAFFIAVFAFWGYSHIKAQLVEAAEKVARDVSEPAANRAARSYLRRQQQNEDGEIGIQNDDDYGKAAGQDDGR